MKHQQRTQIWKKWVMILYILWPHQNHMFFMDDFAKTTSKLYIGNLQKWSVYDTVQKLKLCYSDYCWKLHASAKSSQWSCWILENHLFCTMWIFMWYLLWFMKITVNQPITVILLPTNHDNVWENWQQGKSRTETEMKY